MSVDIESFKEGYMSKKASPSDVVLDKGIKTGKNIGKYLVALAAVTPVIAGTSAGIMHSSLEAPTDTELKNLQKQLISGELKEALAELKRRREFAMEKDTEKNADRKREIRL